MKKITTVREFNESGRITKETITEIMDENSSVSTPNTPTYPYKGASTGNPIWVWNDSTCYRNSALLQNDNGDCKCRL